MSAPDAVDRRGFVRKTLGALGAFFAAIFGIPAAASVVDPVLKSATGGWVPAGPKSDLEDGVPAPFAYEVQAGWEKRKETGFLLKRGDAVIAYSARCTHLGCKVRFKENEFRCPCHKGVFDLDGQPRSGPVKKPLVRFETRDGKNGVVEVKV